MRKLYLFLLANCFATAAVAQIPKVDWAQTAGAAGNDQSFTITTDALGNIYTSGIFVASADFDPGSGTVTLSSKGDRDVFVCKYNANGGLIWAKSFGGPNYDRGQSIVCDASGNVYVAGYFSEDADFDPGPGTAQMTSAGDMDAFLVKLNPSGDFQWAKQFGSVDRDIATSVAIDGSGNIYLGGEFNGTVDFDPGPGTIQLSSVAVSDAYVLKLNAAGNPQWAKGFGGISDDVCNVLATDANGNLFIGIYFFETVDFDPGPATMDLTSNGHIDFAIVCLEATGDLKWAKAAGGVGGDMLHRFITDASGNIYAAGYFSNEVDFDMGAGTNMLNSNGDDDGFLLKLDASGNFVWVKNVGGADEDRAYALAMDPSGNFYLGGYFVATADFDPGPANADMTSNGDKDIFVVKLNPAGEFQWAKTFGGTGNDEVYAMRANVVDNVFASGSFSNSFSVDATGMASGGLYDMFVLKIKEVPAGLFGPDRADYILVYPNPTRGHITIEMETPPSNATVSVVDLNGREVKSLSGINEQRLTLSLEDLDRGVYFVRIQAATQRATIRVIKH